MGALQKLRERIRRKGLRRTLKKIWERYVYFHWELLWMERDLACPVNAHSLKPYPPLRRVTITPQNADAFARYFGDRVETMRELAADNHIGHMYLDAEGHAIGCIWASKHDYVDRHYYGCRFPVQEGECFAFCAEMTRRYLGTALSVDGQLELWRTMRDQGCNKVVNVCDTRNFPALKVCIRMGYHEQGRVTHIYGLFGRWRLFRETRYEGSRLGPLREPDRPAATAAA